MGNEQPEREVYPIHTINQLNTVIEELRCRLLKLGEYLEVIMLPPEPEPPMNAETPKLGDVPARSQLMMALGRTQARLEKILEAVDLLTNRLDL